MARKIIPLEQRFWSKVDKRGPDECWMWTGGVMRSGYGGIGKGGRREGIAYTHRLSWELNVGPIPQGMHILHCCDLRYATGDTTYRRCVNPSHLRLGTNVENISDMVKLKRHQHGETSGNAKLSEASVRAIRASSEPHLVLARRYGVSRGCIGLVLAVKRWAHVA